tara:strand:- start:1564 stop:2274 length:711 start_codon:yes stop_codon:yes gene_type:complete
MILSIDVGIRNLAMCLIDSEKIVRQWDVSGVPPESSDGLYPCMRKHLDDRPWVLDADVVLIEKQPDRNKKMKMVEHFLHAYFVIKIPDKETIIYDARHKIPDVVGAGKAQYRKRKQTSIDRCKEFLEKGPEGNRHWLETFKKSKKKDDLADTVMQALSFNRTTVKQSEKGVSKETKKKIVARKPNENQKNTKYSKPNLVWFHKNKTRQELEKDRRFMKDLQRYYRDYEDFLTNIQG